MIEKSRPIGVFDSGMGGISVLADLIHSMPMEDYIYYGDSKNAPYGIKDVEIIKNLSVAICDFLVEKKVKAIVVACNTATSAAINHLRDKYSIPIIGMEPALKPAIESNTKNKSIIVMATETTLREKKFMKLIEDYGKNTNIIKIPASKLVNLVEKELHNEDEIKNYLEEILLQYDLNTVSSIVLGCTHFIFVKEAIEKIVGNEIMIIDGNEGTTNRLKTILQKRGNISVSGQCGEISIYNSTNEYAIIDYSKQLLTKRLEELNIEAV